MLAVSKEVLSNHKSVLVLIGKLTFLVLGSLLIVVSAFYASSFLAILGTAFLFWGAILFYLTPTKHVPLTMLDSVASGDPKNIQRILDEYTCIEKGIYLPPRNLNDADLSLVFIPKNPSSMLPVLDGATEKLTYEGIDGLCITPPGAGLSKLFENEAGASFTKMNLPKLTQVLPKLMIENLEVAESVEIERSDGVVVIRIRSTVATGICVQAKSLERFHSQIGCLFPSVLACILAKVTGKPIVIRNEVTDHESGAMEVEYQVLEDQEIIVPS